MKVNTDIKAGAVASVNLNVSENAFAQHQGGPGAAVAVAVGVAVGNAIAVNVPVNVKFG
jgi:hypothetical protein